MLLIHIKKGERLFMQDRLVNLRDNFIEAWILYNAVDIGLFNFIGENEFSSKEISNNYGFEDTITSSFLNSLVASGYLEKNNEKYSIKDNAKDYLLSSKKSYMGDMFYILNMYKNLEHLKKRLEGKSINVDSELWRSITKAPQRIAKPAIITLQKHFPDLNNKKTIIIDVGCGRADYLIELAKTNPNLEGVGIEKDKEIVELAAKNIKNNQLSDRIKIINEDFNSINLSNADGVMFNSIFHLIGDKDSENLLKKAFDCLKKDGKVFVLELCKNSQISPKMPVFFDLIMKLHFQNGKSYTTVELNGLLEKSGFKKIKNYPITVDTPNVCYTVGVKE